MKSFIQNEEEYLKHELYELGYEDNNVKLLVSSRPELGDYQYNGIMQLSKIYHENPRDIANKLVESVKRDNHYKDINVAGPGFINITFSDQSLIRYVNELNNDIEINYFNSDHKRIVMDYGGANVAKSLHVGHLRSANIGEALKRLAISLGNDVISDAHLGDWGRPIGLVMLEIQKRNPDLVYFDSNYNGEYPSESPVTNDDLMEIYPTASIKAKNDEEYMEEARELTKRFQKREKGLMALWNHIMKVSKEDIKRIYDKLNTTFDLWEGESDCDEYIPELLELLEEKGVVEESEGAKVINVSKEDDEYEVPPLLLVKSNGTYSYETTDLACILERMKKFSPDEIWYLTDIRQQLHFEQVFRAARKSGIVNENTKLEFYPFGTINGSDGKPFKTRDGGIMKLEDLLYLAYEECEKKILPNIIGDERKEIAEILSISTVKYADLIPYRLTDYNFDPVKFSDLQGKTAPYLLYSTIRMKSLLNNADINNIIYTDYNLISTKEERNIIIELLNLREVLEKSYNTKSLNDITEFLYKITNLYNNLYSNYRILTETNEDIKESWLLLTKVVLDNNIKLLDILGIKIPNRM